MNHYRIYCSRYLLHGFEYDLTKFQGPPRALHKDLIKNMFGKDFKDFIKNYFCITFGSDLICNMITNARNSGEWG